MIDKSLLPPSIISRALRVLDNAEFTTETDLLANHSLLDVVFLGTHEKMPPRIGVPMDLQSESNYRRMARMAKSLNDASTSDEVADFINAATLMAAGPEAEEEAEAAARRSASP